MSVIYWILDNLVFNLRAWKAFFEGFFYGITIGIVGFVGHVIYYLIRYKQWVDFPESDPESGNWPEDHAG